MKEGVAGKMCVLRTQSFPRANLLLMGYNGKMNETRRFMPIADRRGARHDGSLRASGRIEGARGGFLRDRKNVYFGFRSACKKLVAKSVDEQHK